jgi:hypothetical protein
VRGYRGTASMMVIGEAVGITVREAKRLRRRSPKGHQRSLREISAMLSTRGFVSATGRPFSPSSIKSMIEA